MTITLFDFSKAFDSVSCEAIWDVLMHVNFPKKFSNTIMNCLEGLEGRIIVNGSLSKPFLMNRGTKQGDPISPTLFVLVVEVLNRSLQNTGVTGCIPP